MYDDRVDLVLLYHVDKVPEARLTALSHHFEQTVQQLLPQDHGLLRDVSLASPRNCCTTAKST